MIRFWKAIPVCYRLVQPFPPEYFRQEIAFDFKLPEAGRYLLRQGLFYLLLFFIGTDRPAKGPNRILNQRLTNPQLSGIRFAFQNILNSIKAVLMV